MHLYLHRAFFTWLEGIWAEELDKESTERHRRTRMMYTHILDWSLQCEMQLKQASEGSRDIGSLKGRTQNRSNWTEIYVQCFTAMYRWKISIKKNGKAYRGSPERISVMEPWLQCRETCSSRCHGASCLSRRQSWLYKKQSSYLVQGNFHHTASIQSLSCTNELVYF